MIPINISYCSYVTYPYNQYWAEQPVVIDHIAICYDWHAQCTLTYIRRGAHRAHNLNIKWPSQQVNLIFHLGHLGSTILDCVRPSNRSRKIKLLCPDVSRQIGAQQLPTQKEGLHFQAKGINFTEASASCDKQRRQQACPIAYHGNSVPLPQN